MAVREEERLTEKMEREEKSGRGRGSRRFWWGRQLGLQSGSKMNAGDPRRKSKRDRGTR